MSDEQEKQELRSAKSLEYELRLEGMTLDLAEKVVAAIADDKIINLSFEY